MAEPAVQEHKLKSKYATDEKFSESPNKTHIGTTCSVCHRVPVHSRTYYGHLFCLECFHKYIWTPAKSGGALCSGDLKNQQELDACEESK